MRRSPRRWLVTLRVAMLVCFPLVLAAELTAQEAEPVREEPQTASPQPVPEEGPTDPVPPVEEPPADPANPSESSSGDAAPPEAGTTPAEASGARAADPCAVVRAPDEERIDQYRREIFETVCEAAARFDGFFGNLRFDEEARRTHGRAGLQLLWDEHEGFEVDGRLKVKVDFPNLEHRVNAFLGREDRDDFVSGAENDLDFLPTFFEREGGQEWLVGLGYRPVSGDRSSLDVDAGVDVETPLDPFVRVRYRQYWLVGDDNLVRARPTVYWTNQKGYGYGTRLDFERPFGTRTLARWSGNIVFDDETDGGDWDTGVTLYHGFTPDRAIAWFVGIDGETKREVPIEDYGTRLTYRQRMLRDWFFGQVVTGVTWPKDRIDEEREMAFHIGFGFEIQFSGEDLGLGRRP